MRVDILFYFENINTNHNIFQPLALRMRCHCWHTHSRPSLVATLLHWNWPEVTGAEWLHACQHTKYTRHLNHTKHQTDHSQLEWPVKIKGLLHWPVKSNGLQDWPLVVSTENYTDPSKLGVLINNSKTDHVSVIYISLHVLTDATFTTTLNKQPLDM